jgi:3',5'-cyclic AMP phosphodiesterase CpdA
VAVSLVLAGCASGGAAAPAVTTSTTSTTAATTSTPATTSGTAAAGEPFRVVAVGDIVCRPDKPVTPVECRMAATAALAESLHPDLVLPLGDLQYETGRAQDFVSSYEHTWGRLKSVTRPVAGNHEYAGGNAVGYYAYFGEAAHAPDGWYSFDVPGGWHIIVLNSVCAAVGGCDEGSRQYEWLRADLEATTSTCILAAWHHPRWSSGLHHSDATYEPFWRLLAHHGADVVLSGHDHHYERFAPKHGVVQFVVGTGGRSLYPVVLPEAGTVVSSDDGFGVLELQLHDHGYVASFRPIAGNPFTDSVSAGC